ncbi:protein starmaker-like [Hordeum vulgare]|nr:protein starmaker-like [Hordeum vulgare]
MLRQSSSRNHRSKGLKLKKALQISLLVLVSVWLLYQVKHSYEKKAAYNENDANREAGDEHKDDQSQTGVIKLGRKDLPVKEADSSTLDERIEDEENEEMDPEMKRDEHDDDPIDEPDLDKDDDLPEPGEHSANKDEGSDGRAVFEDEERKERSQEDQEKSFHGDDVSSAVTHDPPSSQQDELTHHAQEKILFVDDASTAVPHENQEPEHKEEEDRKASGKGSRGENVSSSVDHDAQVTNPLPDEQLKNMDRIFEGTTNLSNGITFRGPGVNGTNVVGEHEASSKTNASSDPNTSTPSMVLESKPGLTPVNMTSNHAGPVTSNSTSLKGQHEQPVNSTAALDNQTKPFTDLTSAELNSPPNGTTVVSGSADAQKAASRDGDSGGNNSDTSSTLVSNKEEAGDTQKEDADVSTKIMNKAIGEGEVLLE